MSEVEKEKTVDYGIRDINGDVIYTTNEAELEEALFGVLTSGAFVKTFSLFNGKVDLTFTTITDAKRMKGYELIRDNIEQQKDGLSKALIDAYNLKVNIGLQILRIKIDGHTTNLAEGSLEERVTYLSEMPEEMLRLLSKYLMIFANITNMAFNREETLKN